MKQRLLFSFVLALLGHFGLLASGVNLYSSSTPQLISNKTIAITLNQSGDSRNSKTAELAKEQLLEHQPPPLPVQSLPVVAGSIHKTYLTATPSELRTLQKLLVFKPNQKKKKNNLVQPAKLSTQTECPTTKKTARAAEPIAQTTVARQSVSSSNQTDHANSKNSSSSVVKARPLYQHNPKPEYPNIARRRGWEGIVILEVSVSKKGEVQNINLHQSSGHALLDGAAIRAVKKWKFIAGNINGHPSTTTVLIPINFLLR